MSSFSKYPSPLAGYEDASPLPEEQNADKTFVNPTRDTPSDAYREFVDPLDKTPRGGFDVHVYYSQQKEEEVKYARELWERIRREFPELSVYRFWDRPVGPHPISMFEVNVYTPAQFGAFVPWLAIWRGPLSVLVHPNTVEEGVSHKDAEKRNHSERAIWMGEKVAIDLDVFDRMPN